MPLAPFTAIVTAFRRVEQTLATLRKLSECIPPPAEIIVHIDGNEAETFRELSAYFPEIQYILSSENLGPGGGRNKMIAAAGHDLVASFDDDSFPLDRDYFARAAMLASSYPSAAIFVGTITHAGESPFTAERTVTWVSDFLGGGCIYRKSVFLSTTGYVPLPTAYGMEEVDLALRLHADGRRILATSWLRIFHDTDLKRHADPEVTAVSVANLFLLTFLRYPVILWPVGMAQVVMRIVWLTKHERTKGIVPGIFRTPFYLYRNRTYRRPLPCSAVRSYLMLRRNPVSCPWLESLE